MLLEPQEAQLFFKLHGTLMFFVNDRLQILPEKLQGPEEFSSQPPAAQLKVRDAFLDDIDLIEAFVDANPGKFSDQELEIVLSWHHLLTGQFYIFRALKKYTVFLSSDDPPIAYGVTALTRTFEELVGPYLPVITETVLLPFRGKIIYDGLLTSPGVSLSFGAGIRRMLTESYQKSKERYGVVTSLPLVELPAPAKKASKPKTRSNDRRSDVVQSVLTLIVGMIDEFCREQLNNEYAVLCRKLAEKLARKRPSPLQNGKPHSWACAIVRTVGWVNFLDDPSQTPHLKLTALDKAFGVSQGTGQGKSKTIRDLLKIGTFDPEWTLPSRMADNPLIWMLSVNGFMMDIRYAPREAQEIAFEQGLIPYIPADRADKD